MERFNFSQTEFLFFLVDDDTMYLDALEHNLVSQNPNYRVKKFLSAGECLKNISLRPDFVILDYNLDAVIAPNKKSAVMNGAELLKKIKDIDESIMAIMLSAQDDLKIALDSIKLGALDYVIKNDTAFLRLRNLIKKTIDDYKARSRLRNQRRVLGWVIIALLLITILAFVLTQGWPEKFNKPL